ncbi:MAG: RNA pseudouridine synthase [Gallionellaceae bacterium CG1_02_60_325]|nr:MAG: RNA pseudouridine synthase [Gallionellaceae bacterium CG1_02_60_325]
MCRGQLSAPCFELVFQDESLLIANKPAGLLAVPGRGADKQDCLSARIREIFPDALIVHRLDMATSGLILFARGAAMQREMSRLFREREVAKRYLAVVQGTPEAESGEIDLPIGADWSLRPLRQIDRLTGKHALTRYRVTDSDATQSRLVLEPVTGRTHQLRLHLAEIGHPILGDALYGDARSAPRLLLHCCALEFTHPGNGEALRIEHAAPF